METYTWDEIYERAKGCAYLSPELDAKDEAMWQVGEFGVEYDGSDVGQCSIVEDGVGFLCEKYDILFDENGNIVSHKPIQVN